MPRSALLFLALLLIQTVAAQTPIETHERIRTNLADRNFLAAAAELRRLEATDLELFRANNYDYLLGRVSEKLGDSATAMANFQSVANRNSILKEYALWHLSRLARASGNLLLERIYLQELLAFSSESLLGSPARRRLAESWFDSGNYDLAIRQIERRSTSAADDLAIQTRRKDVAFLGEAYLGSGNTVKARELLTALVTDLADPAQPDDFALIGARGLDSLDRSATIPPALSDYDHLRRASVYQFNRDFERARYHYAAIINEHPASGLVPDAIYQTGRGYVLQNDFAEALQWLERVLEQFPQHPVSQEALLQAASAYSRLGKYREAVVRYKKYIENYPEGERADRAYLNIIDVLRDLREETEALKWAAVVRDKFKGKQPEALAVFAEARIRLARTDWEGALDILDSLQKMPDLGGARAPGGTTVEEVHFLRGFALENLRRYSEAIDVYLSIPDGRNEYYGWRASARLRQMMQDPAARMYVTEKANSLRVTRPTDPESARKAIQASLRLTDRDDERNSLLGSLRAAYGAIPAYSSAPKFKFLSLGRRLPLTAREAGPAGSQRSIPRELLFLGLYDEAAPEVEAVRTTIVPPENRTGASARSDLDYTLAVLYTRGDLAHRGSAFVESAWKIPADYHLDLIPREILKLLYPTPYADALLKHAPPRNVDPRFLLSIMRQESRFRSDVKSNAAARGLMQFISTTASRVAAELERENFRQDDLYDPSTAILFGSHYTANLFKLFPGQPPAVAASYNGGEDNMKRWLSRAKTEQADHYVPEILFSQSKDYLHRVMANYRIYQMLYDENLKRK